jgi:hypothetical protein
MFGIESGILLTALPRPEWDAGHIGGTEPQHPRVTSGSSRQVIGQVESCLRGCAAGLQAARLALLRQRLELKSLRIRQPQIAGPACTAAGVLHGTPVRCSAALLAHPCTAHPRC